MAAFLFSSLNHSTTPIQSHLSSAQLRAVSTTAAAEAPTRNLRVIFAAGGTGGHIYPAIAIAEQLKTLNPNAQFLFVGTPTGMEAKAVPSAGFPFTAAPLARPYISLHNLFVLPFTLTNSVRKNLEILQEFDPHMVIGTGGFVSFPTCLAAAIRGRTPFPESQIWPSPYSPTKSASPSIRAWSVSGSGKVRRLRQSREIVADEQRRLQGGCSAAFLPGGGGGEAGGGSWRFAWSPRHQHCSV